MQNIDSLAEGVAGQPVVIMRHHANRTLIAAGENDRPFWEAAGFAATRDDFPPRAYLSSVMFVVEFPGEPGTATAVDVEDCDEAEADGWIVVTRPAAIICVAPEGVKIRM